MFFIYLNYIIRALEFSLLTVINRICYGDTEFDFLGNVHDATL